MTLRFECHYSFLLAGKMPSLLLVPRLLQPPGLVDKYGEDHAS